MVAVSMWREEGLRLGCSQRVRKGGVSWSRVWGMLVISAFQTESGLLDLSCVGGRGGGSVWVRVCAPVYVFVGLQWF